MSQLLTGKTIGSSTEPVSFQKAEVIPNKIDSDGHHYLKVLLLSNKKTRNNWIAPFKTIGELPKPVLDSFMNLPHVSKHDHTFFDDLDETMKNSGLSTEERYQKLLNTCNERKEGYIDWLFLDNPNATALYGQLKVTDPEENRYIQEHGVPSKVFTSPALAGTYDELEDGTKVYHIDTIRAFHLAGVPVPAFEESEAMVKGICKNGNSESCRDYLQYAGVDTVDQAPSPSENVNNTCSCNNNIDNKMSANDLNSPPQVTTAGTTTATTDGSLLKPTYTTGTGTTDVKYTIEQPVTDKPTSKPVEKVIERNSAAAEVLKSEKQISEERERERILEENNLLKKQVLEQKNFFLDEMLSVHIPRTNYEKEEDYIAEKNVFKTFINKYEVNLEDAKWLITKAVVPKPQVQAPNPEEENKKSKQKPQYAGWEGPSMFQTSFLTTPPPTKSGSVINNDSKKEPKEDNDYDIVF